MSVLEDARTGGVTHAPVDDDRLEVGKHANGRLTVLDTAVDLEAIDGERTLAHRQALRGRRVVGQDQDGHQCNEAGDGTLHVSVSALAL